MKNICRHLSFLYQFVAVCGLALSLSSCSTLQNRRTVPVNSQRLFAKQELFRKSEKAIVDAHPSATAPTAALDTKTATGSKTGFITLPKVQLPNVFLAQRLASVLAGHPKKNADTCDLIILASGEEIRGKVTEIGLQEIRYKKCENLDGPTVVIEKSDVFIIHYANGTKEVINGKTDGPNQQYRNNGPFTTQPAAPVVPEKKTTTTIGDIGAWCSFIGWICCFTPAAYEVAVLLMIFGIIFQLIGLLIRSSDPEKYSMKGWGWIVGEMVLDLVLLIIIAGLIV